MRFQRFFCLFLLLLMVLCLFSGCTFFDDTDKQEKISSLEAQIKNKDSEIDDLKKKTTTTSISYNVNTKVEPKVDNPFEYEEQNGKITITKYVGNDTDVVVPLTIEDKPVVQIGKNAFAETKIKSISLPEGITKIDWFAFYGCYNLSNVSLPKTLTYIGYGAFDGCSKSLCLSSSKDSYGQKFADSFGIRFQEI